MEDVDWISKLAPGLDGRSILSFFIYYL